MKKTLLTIVSLMTMSLNAQSEFSNGALSTGTTTANGTTTSPTGYTWSELQSVGGLTNTNLGFGAIYNTAGSTNLQIADDFIVPSGETWTIQSIDLFVYQTSHTGTTPPIDAMRLAITNTFDGANIAGSMTTNVYNSAQSSDALMYRIGNNNAGTTRKIWKTRGNLSSALTAGTYWLKFQVHATNDGSIFFPPVTIKNQVSTPNANAKQYSGTAWSDIIDAGSSQNVAMPFIITYTGGPTQGVSEIRQYDSRVIVYPNPTYDSFKIDIPKESISKATTLSIFDASGKKVKEFGISESYNISELKSGIYMIKINDGTNLKVTKIIKK